MNVIITVNTPTHEYEYTDLVAVFDICVAKHSALHPDWTSMVLTIVRPSTSPTTHAPSA